jgi:MoxR-like ATPase
MTAQRTEKLQRDVEKHHTLTTRLIDGLERVIRGKRRALEYLVTGLLAGGHVLIEDVPGLGKTTLAKTAARLISRDKTVKPVTFRRIQFTPDLLPYDITGVDIFDPEHRRFVFKAGPVFASIVLADEINRTTPKVQSALLEVMAENQVTVGNKTHTMDPLFFVVATQNPVETDGTYSLPLAQLDRFLMRISIGYPGEEDEIGIVREDPSATIMPKVKPICSKAEVLQARKTVERIFCDERLLKTAVGISVSTRHHRGIELGCSPRASLMLVKAARAFAMIRGRSYCIDQDFLELAPLVLSHRIRLKDIRIDTASLIREITLHELSRIAY